MSDNPARADLVGFTLTHKVFRHELPRLVDALDRATAADQQPSELAEDHLRLVSDHLVRHHQEEDEFHWPTLAARWPAAASQLSALEEEHVQMDPLVELARDRDRRVGDRAAALRSLTTLVMGHLDEEDRSIVPLLYEHITAPEQRASMERSRSKIPASDELRILALMLDAATEDERDRMLSDIPPEAVTAWRTLAAPALADVHRQLATGNGSVPR